MVKPNSQITDRPENPGNLKQHSRIFLAGHRGMVGSAIYRHLQAGNYGNIITRSRGELDLTDQAAVRLFLKMKKSRR